MQFRGPNFYETNANFYKDTPITERVNFQIPFRTVQPLQSGKLRRSVDMNIPDGSFGAATASHEPRFWQIGGRLSF